ncbi:MAG: pseudouridine synthase [Halopseudomonas sp.]
MPQVNPGVTTVLQYLIGKFPAIEPKVWQQRALDGKLHWHDGSLISAESAYQPQQRIYYYREVEREPVIPFAETILYQDEHILVADKPHFLPVTPAGNYINECLQNRLRQKTGIDHLQALHRLDRVTAGLVLFSTNPDSLHLYHDLFANRQMHKSYQAIATVDPKQRLSGQQWQVKNRLQASQPRFLMRVVDGEANSHSLIRCLRQAGDKALFELEPVSGKTHQLRVHMQTLGWPILNDRYYPTLQPKTADDYARPLQLLAKSLHFNDPLTGATRSFSCDGEMTID